MLTEFGLDVAALRQKRRVFCRPCLDWSERRHHVAGSIGAGLFDRLLELGWVTKDRHSRAVSISATGREGLAASFGVTDLV